MYVREINVDKSETQQRRPFHRKMSFSISFKLKKTKTKLINIFINQYQFTLCLINCIFFFKKWQNLDNLIIENFILLKLYPGRIAKYFLYICFHLFYSGTMEKLIKCKSRNARREMNFTLRYLPKEIEYFVCFCLIGFIKHKNEIFIVFHLKKIK